jgi:hypothetical protein
MYIVHLLFITFIKTFPECFINDLETAPTSSGNHTSRWLTMLLHHSTQPYTSTPTECTGIRKNQKIRKSKENIVFFRSPYLTYDAEAAGLVNEVEDLA